MEFLKESHPERLNDHRLTIACADAAAETYEQTIRNGGTPGQAIVAANNVLFRGLHFSRHDTLVNILWNEFADEVPEDESLFLLLNPSYTWDANREGLHECGSFNFWLIPGVKLVNIDTYRINTCAASVLFYFFPSIVN